MHDTDSITKDYMKDAATFADAFNFLLYNGEPVIQPGQLREMDTTMLALPFGEDGVTVPEQKSRDVLKFLTAKADDNAASGIYTGKTGYLLSQQIDFFAV